MTRTLHNALVGLILAGIGLIGVCGWAVTETVLTEKSEVALLNVTAGVELDKLNAQVAGTTAHLSGTADQVAVHLNRAVDKASGDIHGVSGELRTTLAVVNRPCMSHDARGMVQPCGTLADLAQTLKTARGTAGEVEFALRHENRLLDDRDKQEADIYRKTSDALAGFPALEQGATAAFSNLNVVLKNSGAISGDLYTRLHPILDPPPCKSFGCRLKVGVEDAHAVGWTPEAGYWLYELIHAAAGK